MKKQNKVHRELRVLVVDIGNTSTSYGFYNGSVVKDLDRFDTGLNNRALVLSRMAELREQTAFTGIGISSVVPKMNVFWEGLTSHFWPGLPVVWVGHKVNLGVKLHYPKPETIGPDRLANVSGAVRRYGAPVIAADFGTAATFDVVTRKQGFVGGVITPGLPLMLSYLHEKTALLPAVSPGPVKGRVGTSTEQAMRMGALWGFRGMIKEILEQLTSSFEGQPLQVCATGGHAEWVLRGSGLPIPVDHDLTLFGIGHIFELNQKQE